VFVGNELYAVKWRDWKLHFVWQPTKYSPVSRFSTVPKLVNLIMEPREEMQVAEPYNTWSQFMLDIVTAFQASTARFPNVPVEDVEAICDELTRQGACMAAQEFLTWPDGTATVRYGFRHVLYREVLYERLGMSQRTRWHRLVAERLEAGYSSRAREMARGAGAALWARPGRTAVGAVSAVCSRTGAQPPCVYGGLGALPPGTRPARDPARKP
jgi:hypothetical protein